MAYVKKGPKLIAAPPPHPKMSELREARRPMPVPLIPEMKALDDSTRMPERYQHILAGEVDDGAKFGVRVLLRKVVIHLSPRQIKWLAKYERETEIGYEEHVRRAVDGYIKGQEADPLPKAERKKVEMGSNWDEDVELVTFGLR